MDAEVVGRARRGDRRAQEELLRGIGPRLLRLALRLTGDAEAAESIVEEALFRGMMKLDSLRSAGAVHAWFRSILIHVWRDRLRSRRRRELRLDDVPEPAAPEGERPEHIAAASELRRRVARAMASLPPAQRAVLALHVDEGLTVSEIAAALETTADRVKANLWHGRNRLRRLLADLLGEKDEKR